MEILLKSIIILPIIDFIYLKAISSHFSQQILDVQNSPMTVRLAPAVICYIALVVALNYFILNTNNSKQQKVLNAFILGLCIYAVYETTNYALLEKWSLKTVIIDTLWGGILFALTTFIINSF